MMGVGMGLMEGLVGILGRGVMGLIGGLLGGMMVGWGVLGSVGLVVGMRVGVGVLGIVG